MASVDFILPERPLHIRALGPLSVSVNGVVITELQRAPVLHALLGFLILHRGEWVKRSKLAGTFWPDVQEEQARRALNTQLWRLRQWADGRLMAAMHTTRDALAWHLPSDAWLDLIAWDASMKHEESQEEIIPSITALQQLVRQVTLYRGHLFEGIEGEWCEEARYHYSTHHVASLRTLTRGYAAHERWTEAVTWGTRWVEVEPYDENAHAALIQLHRQSNQPVAAVRAYQKYAAAWAGLGLPPDSSLRLLAGEAELAPSHRAQAPLLAARFAEWSLYITRTLSSPALQEQFTPLRQSLFEAIERGTAQMAALHEAAFDWEAARANHELALAVIENEAPARETKRKQVDLRLKLDTLYDRAANRPTQRNNLDRLQSLMEELGEGLLKSEVWARYCWFEQRVQNLDAAFQAAAKALAAAGNDAPLRAQALRLLGTCHDLRGQYAQAVRIHQQALAAEAPHSVGRRLSHISLANTLLAVNKPWRALAHAEAMLCDTPAMPPTLVDILALGNAATVHIVIGRFEQAQRQLQQALAYAKLLGARVLEAWIITRQAMLFFWTGMGDEARFWAEEAWLLSQEVEDKHTPIEVAIELAHLAGHRESTDVGIAWCERAQALSEHFRIVRYEGRLMLLRAYLAAQGGDHAQAGQGVQQCLALIATNGQERLRLPAIALMGHLAQQTTDQAGVAIFQQGYESQQTTLSDAPDEQSRVRYLRATALRQWVDARIWSEPHCLQWVW